MASRKPQHAAAGLEYRVVPAGPDRWRIIDRQQRNHGAYTDRAAADKACADLNAKAARHAAREESL